MTRVSHSTENLTCTGITLVISFGDVRETEHCKAGFLSGQKDLTVNQTRELRGFESLTRHAVNRMSVIGVTELRATARIVC